MFKKMLVIAIMLGVFLSPTTQSSVSSTGTASTDLYQTHKEGGVIILEPLEIERIIPMDERVIIPKELPEDDGSRTLELITPQELPKGDASHTLELITPPDDWKYRIPEEREPRQRKEDLLRKLKNASITMPLPKKASPWYTRLLIWLEILEVKERDSRPYRAERADLSAEVLHLFARSDDVEVRKVAAAHKNTATADLKHLSKDEDVSIRKLVAGNEGTLPATLQEMSKDSETSVRELVAGNGRTTDDTLITLSDDEEESVRLVVLENENAPAEALAIIFWKLAEEYRKTENLDIIATSQRIDPEILSELSQSEIDQVRLVVARNGKTPKSDLTVLAVKDNSAAVREAAVKTLEGITGTNWIPVIALCAFFSVLALVGYKMNTRKQR